METISHICSFCGAVLEGDDPRCAACDGFSLAPVLSSDPVSASGFGHPNGSEKEIVRVYPIWLQYAWQILWGILLLPLFGFGLVILIPAVIRRYSRKYIITNRKVIIKDGILANYQDIIPIKNIRTLRIEQTPLQRVLNIGTVILAIPGGQKRGIRIKNVARPAALVDIINTYK